MVYLYRCPDGHTTELDRPVQERDTPAFCVHCGQQTRRMVRLGGIGFKGPGFYSTDSRPATADD